MPFPLAAMAIPAIATGLGKVLGGAGKGAAESRAAENQAMALRDKTLADLYGTQQGAGINLMQMLERGLQDRAKLALEAPSARLNQLIRGSLLANVQPARITGGFSSNVRIPQLSGGLSPSALSAAARTGGAEMQRQALLKLFSGQDVPKMPNFAGSLIRPPQLSEYKQAGKGESLLSGLGLGAGILGSVLGPLMGQQRLPSQSTGGIPQYPQSVPSDPYRYRTPPYVG
jgi:hypothetical protein